MNEEKISLSFKEGGSDKVYMASLENKTGSWEVNFAYGRRGNSLTTGCKGNNLSYGAAKKIFDKLVKEKTGKGYKDENQTFNVIHTPANSNTDSGHRPQLLNEMDEADIQKYLDNDGWCMQEKWDGKNRLLIKDGDIVIGTNRKGIIVGITDDIKQELSTLPDCVLADEDLGDKVMIFDIISLKTGYNTRITEVTKLLKNCTKLIPTNTFYDKKDKVHALKLFKKNNHEGVVFKQLDAYYTPGRPASGGSQLKFKFTTTCSVIAGDVNKGKRSVSMFVFNNKLKIHVGNVTIYPNQEIPKNGDILEIKYLYFFKEGSLFQPVYLGQRTDLDEEDCTLKQLKYKKED